MKQALGLLECEGYATAIAAADAALKSAEVTMLGYETVIGLNGTAAVIIKLMGEVAAVKASIDAGKASGNRVGTVVSAHVIPRPHEEVDKVVFTDETRNTRKNLIEEEKAKKPPQSNKQQAVSAQEAK